MQLAEIISIDRVVALVVFVAGVVATKMYGSNYLPRRRGFAIEKYMVTDIIPFRTKSGTHNLSQIQLVKSSIKNSCGFAGAYIDDTKIVFHHYGFANNCLHAIIAPGYTLYDESHQRQRTQSNEYKSIDIKHVPSSIPLEMLPKKYKSMSTEAMMVRIMYDFPKTYTGPLYREKSIIFMRGIGIVKAVTTYSDGTKDEFTLKRHKVKEVSNLWWPLQTIGNYWLYDIQYAHGPNKINIKQG